jgi:hypothetical protein
MLTQSIHTKNLRGDKMYVLKQFKNKYICNNKLLLSPFEGNKLVLICMFFHYASTSLVLSVIGPTV